MWGCCLFSAVLGTERPGPGTIYLGQSLRFIRPVGIGDVITASVTVTEKKPEGCVLVLDCRCVNQKGETVITGQAEVRAPCAKVRRTRLALPDVRIATQHVYRRLNQQTTAGTPTPPPLAPP